LHHPAHGLGHHLFLLLTVERRQDQGVLAITSHHMKGRGDLLILGADEERLGQFVLLANHQVHIGQLLVDGLWLGGVNRVDHFSHASHSLPPLAYW
jgi:hypothetical protein